MRLPEQMRRSPNFDIRSCVHIGLDFDLNGHFTPLFDGIAYIMIPQWANISSIDDIKKIKINISGQEIDFSKLDLSRISHFNKNEKPKIISEEINESKSWFSRWFSSAPTPLPPSPPPSPTSVVPLTRKTKFFFFLKENRSSII